MNTFKTTIRISSKNKKNMDIRLAKLNENKEPCDRISQEEYIDQAIAEKNSRKDWAVLSS